MSDSDSQNASARDYDEGDEAISESSSPSTGGSTFNQIDEVEHVSPLAEENEGPTRPTASTEDVSSSGRGKSPRVVLSKTFPQLSPCNVEQIATTIRQSENFLDLRLLALFFPSPTRAEGHLKVRGYAPTGRSVNRGGVGNVDDRGIGGWLGGDLLRAQGHLRLGARGGGRGDERPVRRHTCTNNSGSDELEATGACDADDGRGSGAEELASLGAGSARDRDEVSGAGFCRPNRNSRGARRPFMVLEPIFVGVRCPLREQGARLWFSDQSLWEQGAHYGSKVNDANKGEKSTCKDIVIRSRSMDKDDGRGPGSGEQTREEFLALKPPLSPSPSPKRTQEKSSEVSRKQKPKDNCKINVNHKNPEVALRRKGNQFEALATLLETKEENPRIPANNNLNAEGGGSTKDKAPIPTNSSQNTLLLTPANVVGSNPTQRHSSNTSTRGCGGRQSIGKGRGKCSGTGDVSFNAMFNMTSSLFVNVENIGMFQFSGLSLPTKEHTTMVNRLT
nr:hypothetical protein Iba_chr01cCG3280 [Ipomoea batatas]